MDRILVRVDRRKNMTIDIDDNHIVIAVGSKRGGDVETRLQP